MFIFLLNLATTFIHSVRQLVSSETPQSSVSLMTYCMWHKNQEWMENENCWIYLDFYVMNDSMREFPSLKMKSKTIPSNHKSFPCVCFFSTITMSVTTHICICTGGTGLAATETTTTLALVAAESIVWFMCDSNCSIENKNSPF